MTFYLHRDRRIFLLHGFESRRLIFDILPDNRNIWDKKMLHAVPIRDGYEIFLSKGKKDFIHRSSLEFHIFRDDRSGLHSELVEGKIDFGFFLRKAEGLEVVEKFHTLVKILYFLCCEKISTDYFLYGIMKNRICKFLFLYFVKSMYKYTNNLFSYVPHPTQRNARRNQSL